MLKFRVSQALFSSHQIDTGTQRLLKTVLDFPFDEGGKILDLGCGYGPIGLTLAKRNPGSFVHMVDRDILAVDYARQNGILNGLDNCIAYGSLGYDDVTEHDFDLIISNIPGKAGETVITALLEDARYYTKNRWYSCHRGRHTAGRICFHSIEPARYRGAASQRLCRACCLSLLFQIDTDHSCFRSKFREWGL